jgi:hypothetical protein
MGHATMLTFLFIGLFLFSFIALGIDVGILPAKKGMAKALRPSNPLLPRLLEKLAAIHSEIAEN